MFFHKAFATAAVLLVLAAPSRATLSAPVSLNLGSADALVSGRPASVVARIEAGEDIALVQFSVLPSRDWRIQDGTSNFTGALKANQILDLRFTAVPLTGKPEPLRAQLAISGYPNQTTSLDPSRMGGATPEITVVRLEPLRTASFDDPRRSEAFGKTGERSAFITVTASGRFVYFDTSEIAAGVKRPVRNAKVKLYDQDKGNLRDDSCAKGTTDSNGNFLVTGSCGDIGSGPDVYIGVELDNDIVDVRPEGLTANSYAFYGAVKKDHTSSVLSLGEIVISANKDAFQAHNLVMRAHEFMVTQGETLPKVKLRWPSTDGTYYTSPFRILHISQSRPFEDEAAVFHEYGHHILQVKAESPAARYDNGICDFPSPSHCEDAPENGVIAWTEGWPSFFGSFMFKLHTVEDSYGSSERLFEQFTHDFPGQEDKIEGVTAAILVDMTDTTNDDQSPTGDGRRDAVSLAFSAVWNVVRNYNPPGGGVFHNHPTSIQEFYDGIAQQLPSVINRVAEVYREHNIIKPQPDLVLSALGTPAATVPAGAFFSLSSTVSNTGAERANNSSMVRFEMALGGTSILLGARAVPPELAAGGANTALATLSIPQGTPPGSYVVQACADASRSVPEADESNNCRLTAVTVQ